MIGVEVQLRFDIQSHDKAWRLEICMMVRRPNSIVITTSYIYMGRTKGNSKPPRQRGGCRFIEEGTSKGG